MAAWFKRSWKNITIVLLLISTVVLTVLIWFGDMQTAGTRRQITSLFFGTGDEIGNGLYSGYREYNYTMSILSPVRASVRSGEGMTHYTDRGTVRELFERASGILGGALTTAKNPAELPQYRWKTVLEEQLILFDFEGEMPLAMLSAVMGTADYGVEEQQARYFVLFDSGETLSLAICPREGSPRCYETELPAGELDALLREYGGGDASFACEDPTASRHLPDLTVLVPDRALPRILRRTGFVPDYTGTTSERLINGILGALGYNPYTTGGYIESDGTRVYVEEFRTLRISQDSALSYYAPEPSDGTVPVTERSAIISRAATLLDRLTASYIGDANIYIQRAFYDSESGRYIILFGCAVDGIVLRFEDGYFARLEYVGTSLVSAHMTITGFLQMEPQESLMPDVQAAAAVEGKSRVFELRYEKDQYEEYRANWYYALS